MIAIGLIDPDTGEIDNIAVAVRAGLRACREWGGQDAPPAYHRNALQWTLDRAQSERLSWRRDHGLPDDSLVEMIDVSTWTDSFRRVS